jgi:uncharacterized protein (UPF0332 family)
MIDASAIFLAKAEQSLAGAESELANGRYDNCANRCYYACFQAAIHALIQAGIRPPGGRSEWSHAFVPAQFDGQLVNRRKLYPADLRNVLARTYLLREAADYKSTLVSQPEASRAMRRARQFVAAIRSTGDGDR